MEEKEDVVDEVAGGEWRVGGAVVAVGIAGEIEVGGVPLIGGRVAEDEATVILHRGIEDLNRHASCRSGEVKAEP